MSIEAIIEVSELSTLVHIFRGQRVMFDADLARLYGVQTKNLIKAVQRNLPSSGSTTEGFEPCSTPFED